MSPRKPSPARAIRVPDTLWAAAQAVAEQRDETVSEVIRRALEGYASKSCPAVWANNDDDEAACFLERDGHDVHVGRIMDGGSSVIHWRVVGAIG